MNVEHARRIAVFSDIHGNLHALQAVLAAIDTLDIRTMVCCGDVVGYGAFPNECADLLRAHDIPTLVGNHDYAALGLTDIRFFNDIARNAVIWTQERLSDENRAWLHDLPFTLCPNGEFYFTHASPVQPEQWGYVLTFGDVRAAFERFEQRICFIGHSHQPAIVEKDGTDLQSPEGIDVPLRAGCRYLINVGSVGQPRDRNARACFVEVDLDTQLARFHRIEYDVQAAQAAIIEQGLPDELAERLAFGW
jgi:diadenosine tetraphosphatase ApaH/serine/threonine PP2A family protein phosphatase